MGSYAGCYGVRHKLLFYTSLWFSTASLQTGAGPCGIFAGPQNNLVFLWFTCIWKWLTCMLNVVKSWTMTCGLWLN